MASHSDQVEELLADYRRTREQLASVHKTLLSIKESVTSQDGLITATVGPHGNLLGLVIAEAAYQRYRAAELAREVLRTVTAASGRAAERANATLLPVLPPDSDPAALVAGRADLQPAEITPEPPPSRPRPSPRQHDDDLSYEEHSWMDTATGTSKGTGRGRSR
jgi:hypothetical protein